MKFGGLLVFGKLCSTPIFWPDWRMSSWRKWLTEIFAIGRFGVLVLYLEMPEHIGRTQYWAMTGFAERFNTVKCLKSSLLTLKTLPKPSDCPSLDGPRE